MRYVIIHRCVKENCDCLDRNGVVAYDGFDKAEADYWLQNVPSGYAAELQ